MADNNDDQPILILHLFDVHFKLGKKGGADPVLRELARYIGDEVKNGLAPDMVVFTGDLAYAGLADEYTLAWDWLENQLWPAVGGVGCCAIGCCWCRAATTSIAARSARWPS